MTLTPFVTAALAVVTLQNVPVKTKAVCDAGVIIGGAISTLAGWLPPFAALVSIVWGGLNIYYLIKDRRSKR